MNSQRDYGYSIDGQPTIDWSIKVRPGLECNARCAGGLYTYRVLRSHRDIGYWETVVTKGETPQCLINSIQIKSTKDILADAYAP
jgi:hypothetical protein